MQKTAPPTDQGTPSNPPLPTVRSRGDVRELFESRVGGREESFEAMLAVLNPIIEPANCFLQKPEEVSLIEGVHEEVLFEHLAKGEYEPPTPNAESSGPKSAGEGEDESLPAGLNAAFPWAGNGIGLWTDRHVMLLGRAGEKAFRDTKRAQLQRARRKNSPYRKAGLSPEEAEAAERRRIEERKDMRLPNLEKVLPKTKGEVIHKLGYRCREGQQPSDEDLQVLFDTPVVNSFNEAEGVFCVAKAKLDLALKYVGTVSPGARRRGEVIFRHGKGGRGMGLLEIHCQSSTLQKEVRSTLGQVMEGEGPPQSLIGMVAPLKVSRQEKNLWERIPEGMKEKCGTTTARSVREKESATSEIGEGSQGQLFG